MLYQHLVRHLARHKCSKQKPDKNNGPPIHVEWTNEYTSLGVHLPVSPDRWYRSLSSPLHVPWCLAREDQVKKVGRDDQCFPSLVWRVHSLCPELWRIFQPQPWCPLLAIRTLWGAAQGAQDKEQLHGGPGRCTLWHPCSLLLWHQVPPPPPAQPPGCPSDPKLFVLPRPRAFAKVVSSASPTPFCPDKSYGFQPSIPTAKEPALTQFP